MAALGRDLSESDSETAKKHWRLFFFAWNQVRNISVEGHQSIEHVLIVLPFMAKIEDFNVIAAVIIKAVMIRFYVVPTPDRQASLTHLHFNGKFLSRQRKANIGSEDRKNVGAALRPDKNIKNRCWPLTRFHAVRPPPRADYCRWRDTR